MKKLLVITIGLFLSCSSFSWLNIDQVHSAFQKASLPIENVDIQKQLNLGETGPIETMKFTVANTTGECAVAVYHDANAAEFNFKSLDSLERTGKIDLGHFIVYRNVMVTLDKSFTETQVEAFRKAIQTL